ncbi:hypothetical protein P3T76_004390 [Phytophthora citrophthora]|uniref:Autophagy-related protein 101 n=1 Tax=Phytophthora citrophthora TaxID=4793 RepID=A0AAD9GUR4_9STRA|nr:hypothetical protein P3T76_004390 [Phytophthora citrophthora]
MSLGDVSRKVDHAVRGFEESVVLGGSLAAGSSYMMGGSSMVTPYGQPSVNSMGTSNVRGANSGYIAVTFFERKVKSALFGLMSNEEKTIFEKWIIPVTVTSSPAASQEERELCAGETEAALQNALLHILTAVQNIEHIPVAMYDFEITTFNNLEEAQFGSSYRGGLGSASLLHKIMSGVGEVLNCVELCLTNTQEQLHGFGKILLQNLKSLEKIMQAAGQGRLRKQNDLDALPEFVRKWDSKHEIDTSVLLLKAESTSEVPPTASAHPEGSNPMNTPPPDDKGQEDGSERKRAADTTLSPAQKKQKLQKGKGRASSHVSSDEEDGYEDPIIADESELEAGGSTALVVQDAQINTTSTMLEQDVDTEKASSTLQVLSLHLTWHYFPREEQQTSHLTPMSRLLQDTMKLLIRLGPEDRVGRIPQIVRVFERLPKLGSSLVHMEPTPEEISRIAQDTAEMTSQFQGLTGDRDEIVEMGEKCIVCLTNLMDQ